MPCVSAKRTSSRSSRCSLMYLRPRALRCSTNRSARTPMCSVMENLLSIPESERLDGHLAVDLCRRRRPMADEVADLFQCEVGIDEPLHEGVAQGVRAWPRNLDASLQEIAPGAGGD